MSPFAVHFRRAAASVAISGLLTTPVLFGTGAVHAMTSSDASVSSTSATGAMTAALQYTAADGHLYLTVSGCESYGYILRGFPDEGPSWSTTHYGVTDASVDLGEVPGESARYEADVTCDGENPWDEGDPAPRLSLNLPAETPDEQPSYAPLSIDAFGFSELMWTRELSWNVSGCSETNVVGVRTELFFNGTPVRIQAHSSAGKTNASQFPTGVYTLKAECHTVDLSGDPEKEQVLESASKDIVLSRANLSTGFFDGVALRQNVLRPGDRAEYSSIHSHNRIVLADEKVAGAFEPGESVEIFTELNGSGRTKVDEKTADETGNIAGDVWIPFDENAQSFGIFAIGKTSGYQLDFQSVVAEKPAAGLVVSAGSTPNTIAVESYDSSGDVNASGPSAFEKNSDVAIKVLDPTGAELPAAGIIASTSDKGALEKVEITLPGNVSDGRYTIMAPVPLFAGAEYAAYFYVKDGVVYPTWDGSGEPSGAISEANPGQDGTENSAGDDASAETDPAANQPVDSTPAENTSSETTSDSEPEAQPNTTTTLPATETSPETVEPTSSKASLASLFTQLVSQILSILSTHGIWLLPLIGFLVWPHIQPLIPHF